MIKKVEIKNNNLEKWQNIHMNIFVIFLLLIFVLLMLKIKLSIYFVFDNFETYIKLKSGFLHFERKGTLVKRKKKFVIKKRITKFLKNNSINKKKLVSLVKYIEIEKLDIYLLFGALLLFPTIFSIPLFSTLFEYIKLIPFKKIKKYNYVVLPVYEEFKFKIEIDTVIKIRVFDLIRIIITSLINYFIREVYK